MKILCIPDIHGRDFWKKPCQKWQGPIVFLGDYHDPYPNEVSKEKSLKNLEELVNFTEQREALSVFLLGNHDLGYIPTYTGQPFCRHDYHNHDKVAKLLNALHIQNTFVCDKVVFSHSGILPAWLEKYELYNGIWDAELLGVNHPALQAVSSYRGGDSVGSCIYGDVREYDEQPHFPEYYQIFGHTQLNKDPIIKKDYACLDCRQCFVVDTETKEITTYNE